MEQANIFLLKTLLNRPIAYHGIFADITGGASRGIFLSQLYYWSDKGEDKDGWIYKTADEWRKETRLTRREIEMSRKVLRELGVLEEKQVGIKRVLWYRLDQNRLFEVILKYVESEHKADVLQPDTSMCKNLAHPSATSSISMCKNLAHPSATSSTSTIYTKITPNTTSNIRARAEELNIQEETPTSSPKANISSAATTSSLEDKPTPQQYIPSSKKPKTPLKGNPENLVIPEIQPRQQWQSSARKCEDAFKPVAPWRVGKGRNQFNAEVIDFLIKSYLPQKPYFASLGEVSRGSAVGWLTKREYDEKGIAEIEAMMIDFNDHKAKLVPLANAKTALSELPSWVRLGREWAFTQYREYMDTGFNAYKFGHPQNEIDIWEEYLSATYPGEIVEKCAEKKRLAWSQIKQTA